MVVIWIEESVCMVWFVGFCGGGVVEVDGFGGFVGGWWRGCVCGVGEVGGEGGVVGGGEGCGCGGGGEVVELGGQVVELFLEGGEGVGDGGGGVVVDCVSWDDVYCGVCFLYEGKLY